VLINNAAFLQAPSRHAAARIFIGGFMPAAL
jgi:hypothetical protein